MLYTGNQHNTGNQPYFNLETKKIVKKITIKKTPQQHREPSLEPCGDLEGW